MTHVAWMQACSRTEFRSPFTDTCCRWSIGTLECVHTDASGVLEPKREAADHFALRALQPRSCTISLRQAENLYQDGRWRRLSPQGDAVLRWVFAEYILGSTCMAVDAAGAPASVALICAANYLRHADNFLRCCNYVLGIHVCCSSQIGRGPVGIGR